MENKKLNPELSKEDTTLNNLEGKDESLFEEKVNDTGFETTLEPGFSSVEEIKDVLKNDNGEIAVKKKKRLIDVLWYLFFTIMLIITILSCCCVAFFDCYIVDGRSMLGTVKHGDRVTVCTWEKAKVGDVVVIKKAETNMLLIKRLIAKGPALVKIDINGNVYVDDLTTEDVDESLLPLEEKYVLPENKSRNGSGNVIEELKYENGGSGYFVEEGKVFYLGDNRLHSTDSRSEGAVSEKLVIGKVSDYFLKMKDKKIYKILNNYYVDKIKQVFKKR